MMDTHRKALETSTEDSFPDLDVAVLGALELFTDAALPQLDTTQYSRPLVLGSAGAAAVGRLLFQHTNAIFADAGNYEQVTAECAGDVDAGVIISASGGKHAVLQAKALTDAGVRVVLYTNNPDAPAAVHVAPEDVYVFPKNREPYTYNTSTYMGMFAARESADPSALHAFITGSVAPNMPETFERYDAFFILLPPALIGMKDMLLTKFDELFGARVSARAFTYEEAKHAKTVVPTQSECFLSFGVENTVFGTPDQREHVPLPDGAGYTALMAIGYYTIGRIQRDHPPYFKNHIADYAKTASAIFGETINPIVE